MKRKSIFSAAGACLFACFSASAAAQSYTLEKTAVAGGGLQNGAGASSTLGATAGQTAAGSALRGGAFSMTVGFWSFDPLAPTAAGVSVAGRVLTAGGQGVRGVRVVLTNGAGGRREAQTGSFGYFRFADVPAGGIYVLAVYSKRFLFAEPSRVISPTADLTDADFIAAP